MQIYGILVNAYPSPLSISISVACRQYIGIAHCGCIISCIHFIDDEDHVSVSYDIFADELLIHDCLKDIYLYWMMIHVSTQWVQVDSAEINY